LTTTGEAFMIDRDQMRNRRLPVNGRWVVRSGASGKRYSAVPVQMELMRIIINENSDQHIIFLKEVEGDRMFPIVIGIFEASSIDRRVKNAPTQRPLTHDLLANTIELLGGELRDVYINEL